MSEEIRYCNNCSNLGLDFKTGKFYCSLSHRSDELPEVLSCDEFRTNCYIKRLQEENEELQYSLKTQCVTCKRELENCRILLIADKYKQALEKIKNFSENFCSNNCPYYTDKESNICNDGCLLDDIVNPIIKKIVEVLNDRD